jgi:hydrogenase expression/formation protein HypE
LPKVANGPTELTDAASLELDSNSVCFTTDSFVVKPLFFNGGDIGKLAVCGTVNDLAVAGAIPTALSLSLIIETGLEFETLDRILESIGETAEQSNVKIVTGDTKTVEQGSADKIFINTAGIGCKLPGIDLSTGNIKPGDTIIINGTIGDHGMTIMSQREGMKFQSDLASDCACLSGLTVELLKNIPGIRFMRDPTRGGLAATLNEIAGETQLPITINEQAVPVDPKVRTAAEILGFDVLTIANEGKVVIVVDPENAQQCLEMCKNNPLGEKAAIIGKVEEAGDAAVVEMNTKIGGRRIVSMPYGRELPRIC